MQQFSILIVFIISITNAFNKTHPFHPTSGEHIHYVEHKFYNLYYFKNESLMDAIKLTNNPNAIIQQNVSNADDGLCDLYFSEIRQK